jgi:hypothetical protein
VIWPRTPSVGRSFCTGFRQATRSPALASLTGFLVLAHALPAVAQPAASGVRFRTIALSGETAPGTDQPFVSFSAPVLNEAGEVAFEAALSVDETGGFENLGIWDTDGLALGLIALEGRPASGTTAGERYESFGAPAPRPARTS